MEELKITLVQTELHWEDVSANLDMFSEKISSINEATDIILLPEMFSTGFSMNAEMAAETMDGKAMQWMKQSARERNVIIVGSLMISESGKFFNRLVWMKPDGTFLHYDKRHLFRLAQEQNTYTRGERKLMVEHNGWKIHPLICYDLRFPVWSRRTKAENYDLLIYVANWPERRVQAWSQLLIGRAIENQSYVAGVNRVGHDGNNIYHSGQSAVINYKGESLISNRLHDNGIETAILNKKDLLEFRKQFSFLDDADEFRIEF